MFETGFLIDDRELQLNRSAPFLIAVHGVVIPIVFFLEDGAAVVDIFRCARTSGDTGSQA